ncbi:MAG: fibronectin type III domain-containing protein [Armatimonadota bacterium]|nr:fibronectin type III domain-containing protein [Armatimonadota bacterium]
MRGFVTALFIALIISLTTTVSFAGQFVYTGDTLPSGSGWEVYHSNSNENGNSISSAIISNGGSNTWRLIDTSGAYRCAERNLSLGNIAFDTGATLAVNIRCSSSNSSSSYNIGISNGNVGGLCVQIRTNQASLMMFDGTTVGSAYTFTADITNYHKYFLTVQNAFLGNNGTATWNLYRDGNLVLTYTGAGIQDNYDGYFAGHDGTTGTGTWYYDWIACNNDGSYGPAQWNPVGPPPAPTLIAPAAGSTIYVPTTTIQWLKPVADAYQVHINTTNNSADANGWDSGVVSSAANSCVTGSLANGLYYIFVRLHTSLGWGAWSAAGYSFIVNTPTAPPGAPTVVAPAGGSTVAVHSPVIMWTGDMHDAYEVHVNTTNNSADADGWDSGQFAGAGSSCISGALANGSYYVFVRLRNLIGWGQWSAGVSFTVNAQSSPPAAPTIITPPDGSNVAIQKSAIRWMADAHDTYEVHINTTNNASDADGWDSGQVTSTDDWCDTGVLANGTYYVFARLRNIDGWGPWSAGHRFTVAFTGAEVKKSWNFLRYDMPYHLELLTHAPEYHVNRLEISHDNMMYAHEPINDVTRRNNINQLIDTAHANGISEVVLWVHEIMFNDLPTQYIVGGKVNLDDPGFWTWMDSEYEQLFTVCPNADGLVFTFGETDADFNDRSLTIHTGKSVEDTFAQAIQTLWNVCSRHNKSLYIRTWHYAGVDRMIRDAIVRNDPAIWMMSKATGAADWNVIQEDYDIIGTCTGHPELEEFDFTGEYWGLTYTPWAGIDYTRHLWSEFALPRGADGMVARIDRDSGNAVQTPNRINMFAMDVLGDYPDCSSADIYSYWCSHWFGSAGSKVASSLKRTFDITNACYGLPMFYPFSSYVANNYIKMSTFDLDCVNASLKANGNFQPGVSNYDLFHGRMVNAAIKLGVSVPSTLFGDFTPASTGQTSPACSATVVDAANGLNPNTFEARYSTDGGATWSAPVAITVTSDGAPTDPYHITTGPIPFGQARAALNKVNFTATNLALVVASQVFTVRGLDNAYVTLGSSVVSDGIAHPQGGDGNTSAASAGGRSCRTPASSGDVNMYFQTDDGYAYDRSPSTIYLQVDYYGSSGSIAPYYDSIWRNDEPLPPVYLSGGTTWRTATWKLDNVNFGHRVSGGNDFKLYVGSAAGTVFVSSVRLSYTPAAGTLAQPTNLVGSAISDARVNLSWNVVAGATKYQVCRNGGAIGWPTTTGYSDTGISPNTQYGYSVTAYDASNNTSCATRNTYVTTLATAPSPATITSNPQPNTWQTSSSMSFTAVGGFGTGKVAYYQYVWDESPRHTWTGSELNWPAATGNPPSDAGWSVWRATSSPTSSPPWLLYDGSTTQRCMSEQTTLENGIPTWVLTDQGRVWNTHARIGVWPNSIISRDTGMTVVGRIRCVDIPAGWRNSMGNLGINLRDRPTISAIIRPDIVYIDGGGSQAVDNGYTYHTYTIALKNATPGNDATATYNLYRDGALVSTTIQGPSGISDWAGPFFGHIGDDSMGGWAWQWVAWNTTGAYPPAASTTLTMSAPHYGSSYYLHVKSFNSDGVSSGSKMSARSTTGTAVR